MLQKSAWMIKVTIPMMLVLGIPGGTGENVRAKQSPSRTAQVKIVDLGFVPTRITIAVGTTLTWTNRDAIPHTVVGSHGVFKSKVLDSNEAFSYTFTKAGSFSYHCSIHPDMTGKIVVR
jgi:plastocyanin